MIDEDKITAADIARERSIARIFGSYAGYVKSLPDRKWTRGEHGWTSEPR